MPKWFNKDNQNKQSLIFVGFFVGLFLISFRKIFSINGILGHNWDWPFPSLDFLFKKIDLWSRFAWWDFNLGLPLNLTLSQLAPNTFVKMLSFIFTPKAVILVLIFLICLTAFLSFKKLLDFINQKNFLNFLPAFLYAFSPFLFNDIIGGSWYMWVSYAVAPLFFLNLVKFIERGKIKFLFGFLIISIFAIASLQHFLLIEIITLGYFLFQFLNHYKINFKKFLQRYFLAHLVLGIFNLYWLLPFFYSFGGFVKGVYQTSFAGAFESVRFSTQNISSIASLVAYLDRNIYYYALTKPLAALMTLAVFLVWVLIISFFIWGEKKDKIKASAWLIILFLLALLIKGGNEPLGGLTMWIYNHFPPMRLYRSPQHLMFAAAFIVPVLVSFSLNSFYQKFRYKKLIFTGFAFCLFFWLAGWWFNGDLGHTILKNQRKDYVDFYQLSPGLSEVYRQGEKANSDYRVFFLPPVNSPAYLQNEYQNLAQGGQPEYMYLKNPTFTSEDIFFAKEIQNAFCHNLKINYLNYLSLFSVKQLVLRADISPLYDQLSANNCWDLGKIKSILDTSSELTHFFEDKYTAAYQIADENFLPYIYAPEKIIEDNGDIQDLKEIVDFKDYQLKSGIYFAKKNEDISQFKPVNDEIFVQAKLENQFLEEESAVNALKLNAVSFPYVQLKAGVFLYDFLLKRETIQEKSLENSEKELFQTKIFNGAKRISEIVKFFNKELLGNDIALEEQTRVRYYQKMEECLELLKKIKGNDPKLFQTSSNDFYVAIEAQQNIVRQLSLPVSVKMKYEEVFDGLQKDLDSLKIQHDFQHLSYDFQIGNNEGEYNLFLKTDYLGGQLPPIKEIQLDGKFLALEEKEFDFKDWQLLFKLNLDKGEHKISLILEEGPNLLGENWKKTKESSLENILSQPINNYEPDGLYQLSFDYTAFESNAGFFLTQDYGVKDQNGQPFPLIFKKLPQTKPGEFSHQDILIKAISLKKPAQISFFSQSMNNQSNQALFQNIKLVRVFEPMVVLKKTSNKNQTSIIPNISFVKINPTKYQVKIQGAVEPFNLIFNQSFNRGWKVYFKGGKRQISEKNHWLVNGYANAWQINPQDNNEGQNDSLVIEYLPQKLYDIGLVLSGMIVLVLLTLVVWQRSKK